MSRIFTGIHAWDGSETIYQYQCDGPEGTFPDVNEAIEACGADVEPHKGESFHMVELEGEFIKLVKQLPKENFVVPE